MNPSQTTITDLHNANLQLGRDGDNQFDFRVDDQLTIGVGGTSLLVLRNDALRTPGILSSSNTIFGGNLDGNYISASDGQLKLYSNTFE